MKMLFTIEDVFESPRGLVIGGTNSNFDTLTEKEIKEEIGEKVRIQNSDGSEVEGVILDVETSSSLIEKKNIFLLFSLDLKKLIHSGSKVFSL